MVYQESQIDAGAAGGTEHPPQPRIVGGKRGSIRRVDWRFLLPAVNGRPQPTEHLVVLGGPYLSTELLEEAGVAGQVSRMIPTDHPVDAIAILVDAFTPDIVRQAAASLVPGGVLYCEINRTRAATWRLSPNAMQRLLLGLALNTQSVYWPAPNFAGSKRYIPLDESSSALRWYFENLYNPGTTRLEFIRRAIQIGTRRRSECFGGMIPWYSIIARAGPFGPSKPAIFSSLNGVIDVPGDCQPLLVTSGQDDASRAVLIPFDPRRSEPQVVVKISRLAQFNANVLNEQQSLRDLHTRLDARTRLAVPRPLGTFRFGNLAGGIESPATGQPLSVSSGRWGVSPIEQFVDLDVVTTWLIAFHRQTRLAPTSQGSGEFRRRFQYLARMYTSGFDATLNERRLFQHIQTRAEELAEIPLPAVWQHNDFGPWNLYRHGSDLMVIDWELGLGPGTDREGPPLSDLLYFVTHWSFVARHRFGRENEVRGFHELFVEPDRADPIINAIHLAITRYLAELQIQSDYLPLLLVNLWVERAVKRLERKRSLGNIGDSPRVNDQFAGFVSHLADHADAFFAACDKR